MRLCFHKWISVPLFDGPITAKIDREPTEEDFGYLRKCGKCGRREAKGWFVFVLPFFEIKFVNFGILIKYQTIELFKIRMWRRFSD